MEAFKAYVPGIYARSEELISSTRDLDRGRTSREETNELREGDVRSFVEAQLASGLDYLSDGLLSWQDIYRPFSENVEGLSLGPLTRFLDTNTFFRPPVLSSPILSLASPLSGPFFHADEMRGEGWVATLPSPYAMGMVSGVEPIEVARRVISPQMARLAEDGCEMVVLQDAELTKGRPDLGSLRDALEALDGIMPFALQMPFGDASGVLGDLVELGVEAIGVDFYSTEVSALPRQFSGTLLAGVVDARNSLLEEASGIADFARRLGSEVGGGLHLVPNGDLQFVPERIARRKVQRLGEAARILREEIGHG